MVSLNSESPKIKSLYFSLGGYEYNHGPSGPKEPNPDFIGREKILERLTNLLDEDKSKSNSGAYLVTGYRGMGKTSVVRETLSRLEKRKKGEEKKFKDFEFSLSQDDVLELELLRQIAWKLSKWINSKPYLQTQLQEKSPLYKTLKRWVFLFSILVTLIVTWNPVPIWLSHLNFLENPFAKDSVGQLILFFGLIFIIFQLLIHAIQKVIYLKSFDKVKKPNQEKIFGITRIHRFYKSSFYKYLIELNALNRELNERLFSSLNRDDNDKGLNEGANQEGYFSEFIDLFKSNSQKASSQTFQKASPKEIEQYLYDILEVINKQRSYLKIPPFIFIIDELDKIEPDYYYTPSDPNADRFLNEQTPYDVITKARKRNEAISKLLANLKNFLSTSKAKFVFIGGRGMYDAALADIADRESFYSSIFNEVLYVPNFFKDKYSNQSDLTEMTEIYLCRLLSGDDKEDYTDFNLANLIIEFKNNNEEQLNDERRTFKILHTLQNFVIYLTYRSNGSPKKMIELIESFIRPVDTTKENLKDKVLLVSNKEKEEGVRAHEFFLKINVIQQYEINFHSNLYRPFISLNSRHLKYLGDKLLYTTAFLVDHILKFHKAAFSWRNLEHLPDIILSNKDPNLRQFYTDIMNDLSKQHLRKTTNAIFQYKFNSKVQNELKYVSKISEMSAAAFNFTLDESYHLKSYYKRKLAAKYNEHKALEISKGDFDYIYTVGFLHSAIADIHYYDEEYDDAILHYSDGLQILRGVKEDSQPMSPHYYMLFLRKSLSLGLCFEKAKMYERAYSIYRSLLIDLKEKQANLISSINSGNKEQLSLHTMQLYQRPYIALLNVIEKDRQDGITFGNLVRNQHDYFSSLGIDNPDKYFPQSKKVFGYKDFSNQLKQGLIDKKRIITLITDYYYNVAGLLFYKNQVFYSFLFEKHKKLDALSQEMLKSYAIKGSFYHPSQAAYLYYKNALVSFNKPYKDNEGTFKKLSKKDFKGKKLFEYWAEIIKEQEHDDKLIRQLLFVTYYLEYDFYKILNSDQFDFLGTILAKLGDSLLASVKDHTSFNELTPVIRCFTRPNLMKEFRKEFIDELKKTEGKLNLNIVFILYRLSYHCYNRAGKKYTAVFQYKKMLYVLKDNMTKDNLPSSMEWLDPIVNVVLRGQIDVSGATNRNQLTSYRRQTEGLLTPEYDLDRFTPHLYQNLSTTAEVKEILLLRESILSKWDENYFSNIYIGEFSTISSVFVRTLELKFKGEQLLKLLKKKNETTMEKKARLASLSVERFNEEIKYLTNSIFCFHEIIKNVQTYGVGYIFNHSFMATVCYRMAEACIMLKIYNTVSAARNDGKSPEDILKDNINKKVKNILDAYEYLDVARLYLKEAMELHSEGSTYKNISKEMYAMDDDYNDNLTHFSAAAERFRMNTGRLEKYIRDLREKLKESKLQNVENYA